MKLFLILTLSFSLSSFVNATAQKVTVDAKNATFKTVIQTVQIQTGYSFIIRNEFFVKAQPVTLKVAEKNLMDVLPLLFENQPFGYVVKGKVVSAVALPAKKNVDIITERQLQDTIRGKVINESGEPLIGASVAVKGTKKVAITGNDGGFVLPNTEKNATLIITYVGYENREISANNTANIKLDKKTSYLDEVQVIPYGTTNRRLNTGSIGTITSKEIENQPVSNPLATLTGRIPGVVVTESSGVAGAGISVQIRGRNSLDQGSEPLYLIDGVPFAPNNNNINRISASALGITGLSPFYSINPADIESIEVLKDADATAIYGSRGANGVVVITTKKGQAGTTRVNANFSSGFSRVTRLMEMMDTRQYLAMRHEAFQNDEIEPDINNAPDLTVWDQNRYTDYQKLLVGETAHRTNAQISISGGTESTKVLFSSGYLKETNVYPDDFANYRGNVGINASHRSADRRFSLDLSANYAHSQNQTPGSDLTYFTNLAPNTPEFYDTDGNLQWESEGSIFDNPMAYLHQIYSAATDNLTTHFNLSYQLLPSLVLRSSFGYNTIASKQQSIAPASTQNPDHNPLSNTTFADNQFTSWIVEPQMEYSNTLWKGKLSVLVGATLQSTIQDGSTITATGFSDESLMASLGAAASLTNPYSTNTQYRYGAVFGRINYNIEDKYLLNLTGRRDGSSRFGPGKQFANFGAVGAAWIFSQERLIEDNLSFLSYGKIRGSYGITGNDQIGDYRFLDAWGPYERNYGNTSALYPMWLYNPNYGWESNKKLEAALELGFFNDRLLISTAYFRNRSGNQLVEYTLPTQTGFYGITANLPALIQNKGWELAINTDNIRNLNFRWSSTFTLTLPENKLLDFPDLETSTYAYQYAIGVPLNLIYGFKSLGVNPETGYYHYLDVDEDGNYNINDYQVHGHLDPKFYGGFRNAVSYKGLEADIFIEFRNQLGMNYIGSLYGARQIPGSMYSQPKLVMDRWQESGDITDIEKYSTIVSSTTSRIVNSDAVFGDASFIRLKNVSLSYTLPRSIVSHIKAQAMRIYMQGQNLITITNYKGSDPESRNLFTMPPLTTYTLGLQLIF